MAAYVSHSVILLQLQYYMLVSHGTPYFYILDFKLFVFEYNYDIGESVKQLQTLVV